MKTYRSFHRTTSEGYPEMVVVAANGCPVAVVSNHAEYKETAANILTALNSHAALLEALEACEKEMRGLDTLIQSGTWRQHFTYAHELSKAAIAKAKAEQS